MKKSKDDEIILSYNDVVLRRSDLGILNGPHFLNDRLIEFYFSYLPTTHPSPDILLLPPSIPFWIMNCPDIESLQDFVQPINFPDKKLVIFPVNDNDDVSRAEGGSHWSLLVYYRDANKFVHHDSCRGLNAWSAKKLYRAVVGYMGNSDKSSNGMYVECDNSPRQVNGYDCGLYVTAIARAICSWYENCEDKDNDALWFSDVIEQVTPSSVAVMRKEIMGLITTLMVKK
ncbi:hypothetical protein ACFE04_015147 [Oxalis oulophora]